MIQEETARLLTAPKDLWPRVTVLDNGHPAVVDSFIIVFFLDRAGCGAPAPILDGFSMFIHGLARGKLHVYIDEDGYTPPLPPEPMTVVIESIGRATERGELAELTLLDTDHRGSCHQAKYHYDPEASPRLPDQKAYLWFRLGQDRVLEDGLGQIVAFVRRLTDVLPYSYAYASPALAYGEEISRIHEVIARHPGFDVAHPSVCAQDLDGRPLGAYWLNVFSKPMTDALGGIEDLKAKLPDATVSPAGQGGTLVILGSEPDAGDIPAGNDLPLYGKLARVLEPMLQVPEVVHMRDKNNIASRELQKAWYRRFLTPHKDTIEVNRARQPSAVDPADSTPDEDLPF